MCLFWIWNIILVHFSFNNASSFSQVAQAHQTWLHIDFIHGFNSLHVFFFETFNNFVLMDFLKYQTSNWSSISSSCSCVREYQSDLCDIQSQKILFESAHFENHLVFKLRQNSFLVLFDVLSYFEGINFLYQFVDSNRFFWDWIPHKWLWYSFANGYWYFFLLWKGSSNWR